MKYFVILLMVVVAGSARSQSIVGTWQQTENKTCFENQLPESETEKELLKDRSSDSGTAVAKLIRFDAKGRGEEGIFSKGKKKGSTMNSFTFKVIGTDLQLLDKKSGIMLQHFVVDELSESSLRIHDAKKDCETRIFTRVK